MYLKYELNMLMKRHDYSFKIFHNEKVHFRYLSQTWIYRIFFRENKNVLNYKRKYMCEVLRKGMKCRVSKGGGFDPLLQPCLRHVSNRKSTDVTTSLILYPLSLAKVIKYEYLKGNNIIKWCGIFYMVVNIFELLFVVLFSRN